MEKHAKSCFITLVESDAHGLILLSLQDPERNRGLEWQRRCKGPECARAAGASPSSAKGTRREVKAWGVKGGSGVGLRKVGGWECPTLGEGCCAWLLRILRPWKTGRAGEHRNIRWAPWALTESNRGSLPSANPISPEP